MLSAGAIDTPRVLMQSGIGRSADLKAVGIEPLVNLQGVGQNLQDHVLGGGPNFKSATPLPESNYNSSEVYMWAKTDSRLPGPDVTTLFLNIPFSTPALPMKGIKNGWSILSGLNRPTSTGTIRLRSGKLGDAPSSIRTTWPATTIDGCSRRPPKLPARRPCSRPLPACAPRSGCQGRT